MHDPMTVAHEIKYPWLAYPKSKRTTVFEKTYRNTFITIWHVDPCNKPGCGDDSCGWFKRAKHGDKKVLDAIVKRFEWDWDKTYTSDSIGKIFFTGYFYPENNGCGKPVMSTIGIVVNLFMMAAHEYFGCNWKKAIKFVQDNLAEIIFFAENPTDSLKDSIVRTFGTDTRREQRIHEMASIIYGWILRREQKWWKHPRWHVHHWKIQIHPLDHFKRWAFSRCCKCGKGFKWASGNVCTDQWDSDGPSWTGEKHVYHCDCSNPNGNGCAGVASTTPEKS